MAGKSFSMEGRNTADRYRGVIVALDIQTGSVYIKLSNAKEGQLHQSQSGLMGQ